MAPATQKISTQLCLCFIKNIVRNRTCTESGEIFQRLARNNADDNAIAVSVVKEAWWFCHACATERFNAAASAFILAACSMSLAADCINLAASILTSAGFLFGAEVAERASWFD